MPHPETPSRQTYATPRDFLDALEKRFGKIWIDLAAAPHNAVCERFLTEENDALSKNWHEAKGLAYCNPPFGKIAPWAKKCREEADKGARILLLSLASVDSNWFAEHVHRHALVLALSPRLTFVGEEHGFNRPLILSCFGWGVGFDLWRWDGGKKR